MLASETGYGVAGWILELGVWVSLGCRGMWDPSIWTILDLRSSLCSRKILK